MIRHILTIVITLTVFQLTSCESHKEERSAAEVNALTPREYDVLVEKALKGGDSEAALRLSQYYCYTIEDPAKDTEWLERAAAMGNTTAIQNLKIRAQSKIDKAEMRRKRAEMKKQKSVAP